MDGERGMLVSDGGPSAAVSIGNYKGVMLCNRPLAGPTPAPATAAQGGGAQSAGTPQPFKSGVVHEPVNIRGYDPSVIERKLNAPERSKKATALSKHKAWLRDLQKQRDQLKDQALLEALQMEERAQKFAEQQKAIRDQIRGVKGSGTEPSRDELASLVGGSVAPAGGERAVDPALRESKTASPITVPSKPKKAKGSKSTKKPAWALTEKQSEEQQDKEASELIEFVHSLDFDTFVDDIEVRAALEAARQRVALLTERTDEAKDDGAGSDDGADGAGSGAESDGGEEGKEGSKAPKRIGALSEANLRRHDASTGGSRTRRSKGGDDAMSMTDTVMSAVSVASSIHQVHSKRSLAAVIDRAKKKEGGGLPTIHESGPPELPPIKPPVISVVDDRAKALADKKKLVGNLPYMNRNPAI